MTTSQYIFTDAQRSREWERLQAIEQIFDPASQRRIQLTGMTQRWRCLEVGAGAGSITRWLAAAVGEDGHVTAVDLDTRFVADLKQPNIEVLEADIMSTLQLAEKYIATGAATQKDLEEYCQFAENQSAWAIYHAMIGVVAQKAIG